MAWIIGKSVTTSAGNSARMFKLDVVERSRDLGAPWREHLAPVAHHGFGNFGSGSFGAGGIGTGQLGGKNTAASLAPLPGDDLLFGVLVAGTVRHGGCAVVGIVEAVAGGDPVSGSDCDHFLSFDGEAGTESEGPFCAAGGVGVG